MSGDSHAPRLLAPGVGVLLGYVLLVGNPWWNRDIQVAVSDSESIFRLVNAMVSYPSWQLDAERFGPFIFWSANIRTLLFVGFAVAGLTRVPRWLRETTGGAGVFVTTVGTIALSAVAAGLASAAVVSILFDTPRIIFPSSSGEADTGYFLGQLSAGASFGVLFGLMLGAVVIAQRHGPAAAARRPERAAKGRTNAPKSFW
jgi:hypothetical protein